jgi:hypothetical protein
MAAQKVGINAATAWYQVGVDQAQKTVNGLQAEIDKLTPKMMKQMDALANKLARTVDITVRVNEVVTRVVGGVSTPVAAPVTTGPGPGVGIRSGQTINVNINGGISTSAEIGKAVVNSIRQFNLLNGPANIQVA